MNGGTIRDNTANYGGGVYIDSGTIHVSGSPVITGNTNAAGKEENVYLKEEQSINIDEHLSTGASIGVTRADAPNVSDNCDPIVIATGATDGDIQYFHSDMTGYTIEAGQGEQADKLLLVTPASTPWSELKEQLVAGNDVSLTDDVTALECDGGYPEISQTVTLDLNGHNITVNENSDNVIFIDENGNFTLTGSGTISGSKEYAVNVYFSTSMFTMNGGTISGGTGGGVNVNKGTFNVLGSPVITGNTKDGNACNVYLNQPKNNEQCIIHVTGPLSADARIGVTTKTVPTGESRVTFAQGSGNYTLTAADASRFSSDASEYFVGYDNLNHVAYLTVNPSDAGIVDITLTGAPNSGFYWATFYNQNWHFTLPEGAAAYTMDSDKHLYRLGDNGRTIPADKAVVIISDSASITLTMDEETTTIADHSGGNILRGNNSAVAVSDLSGTPYVLSLDGSTIGFRQFTGDAIPAHKAYYLQ